MGWRVIRTFQLAIAGRTCKARRDSQFIAFASAPLKRLWRTRLRPQAAEARDVIPVGRRRSEAPKTVRICYNVHWQDRNPVGRLVNSIARARGEAGCLRHSKSVFSVNRFTSPQRGLKTPENSPARDGKGDPTEPKTSQIALAEGGERSRPGQVFWSGDCVTLGPASAGKGRVGMEKSSGADAGRFELWSDASEARTAYPVGTSSLKRAMDLVFVLPVLVFTAPLLMADLRADQDFRSGSGAVHAAACRPQW